MSDRKDARVYPAQRWCTMGDMAPSARSTKSDPVLSTAVGTARAALLEHVDASQVGDHVGFALEAERLGTHYFDAARPGYRGWRWSVTLTRGPRQRHGTVDEIVLLPGPDALTAPAWVPWKERTRPEDLGPGDLLPADQDDPRLVPGYLAGGETDDETDDDDDDAVRRVADEVGLGRERVLSLEGRVAAAERWYDSDHGPESPHAKAAPAPCQTCGFLVPLTGPLGLRFGVCGNEASPDDAQVVSFDHGCGAHSQGASHKKPRVAELPAPVLDTLGYDDLEIF
jgi:hypothetical protein